MLDLGLRTGPYGSGFNVLGSGLTLGALAMVMDYTHHNQLGFVAPLFDAEDMAAGRWDRIEERARRLKTAAGGG